MRKFGVLFASVFLAAVGMADAQEQFPDPPIMVNTPSGTQVPVSIPAATTSAQPYTATTQPVVVPVPISLYVTPNVIQRQVPYTIPVPTPVVMPAPQPVFPAQPPQPRPNSACVPIDGRTPLPFDVPTRMPGAAPVFNTNNTDNNGPLTSTVLRPGMNPDLMGSPIHQAQATNPLLPGAAFAGAPSPAPQPQPQFGQQMPAQNFGWGPSYSAQPYQQPTPQSLEPLTVPPPGVPYSLDAQGRPHYVQQPGTYQFPGPQQWPGYTPVAPQQPGLQQQQQMGYQTGQQQQFTFQPDQGLAPVPVPAELNPTLNPNLTNPNTAVQLVTPEQVKQAVMAGAPILVLDVRGELVRDVIGHIPNDISVPLTPSETFPARVRHAIPNTGRPVVVYCNDGINSSQAANMLANMGYTVYLMGIYTGWGNHIPTAACGSCPR